MRVSEGVLSADGWLKHVSPETGGQMESGVQQKQAIEFGRLSIGMLAARLLKLGFRV